MLRSAPALLAATAALLLLVAGCSNSSGGAAETSATDSSSVEVTGAGAPLLASEDFDLSDHAGKVVLLNFWATWCGPCRAEMPELIQLQKDLGAQGLQVVGVSLDQPGREAVGPFVAERPINYPIVIDADGKIAERYGGVRALPTTMVIGRQGKVKGRLIGALQMEQVRPRLEKLLATDQSAAASS